MAKSLEMLYFQANRRLVGMLMQNVSAKCNVASKLHRRRYFNGAPACQRDERREHIPLRN